MATTPGAQDAYRGTNPDSTAGHDGAVHQPGTETEATFGTMEFPTCPAAVAGVLIAADATFGLGPAQCGRRPGPRGLAT